MNKFFQRLWGKPETQPARPVDPFDLDKPLFYYTSKDAFTLRDAVEGVHIFGSTGSGKTSGSGATLARAYLRAGMGGIVFCSKPEDRVLWEEVYAKETNRSASLIIIEQGQRGRPPPFRFNFLDYEWNRDGGGGQQTENIVSLLTKVVEIVEGKQQHQTGEPFWSRAAQEMIRNTVDVLALALGRITLTDMLRFISDAPRRPENAPEDWQAFLLPMHLQITGSTEALEQERLRQLDEFVAKLEQNFCWQVFKLADAVEKTPQQQHDYEMAYRYWFHHFAHLADRTRSSIVATFTSAADLLTHGLPFQILGVDSNVVPEVTYDGAVIIVDLSIQEYQEVGRIIQGILKYMFQRAVLRRSVKTHPRPVFIWADESQYYANSFDHQFQAVARSARACTVYLTQNISNYYSALGANGHDEAHALLASLSTKYFHANADPSTNEYAANAIAQSWTTAYNFNSSFQSGQTQGQAGQQMSGGGSQIMQYKVMPAEFTILKKGGPQHDFVVEAIVFQGGRVWQATGDTFLKVRFKQQ